MEDPMIINNEIMNTLALLLQESGTFLVNKGRGPVFDEYYVKNIIVKFDGIEQELFPTLDTLDDQSSEIIMEHLKKIFSGRSLIDIRNALKNSIDKTDYNSYLDRHDYLSPHSCLYCLNIDNYLGRVIVEAELKILINKVNDLSDKFAIIIDYFALTESANKK